MGNRGGPERAAVLRRLWRAIWALRSRNGPVGPYLALVGTEVPTPH